ncbi:MAG: sugar ABC transporter permease [Acholeplasmataceae bacterium]
MKVNGKKKLNKNQYIALLWLLPALILLLIFSVYPPIMSLIFSFTNANGAGIGKFIFFDNYIELFTSPLFYKTIKNVIIFIVAGMIVGNVSAIFLAELLYNMKSKKSSSIYRYLFIIPVLVPGVVVVLIWQYIVFAGGDAGIANMILSLFKVENQNWYFDVKLSMFSIIMTGFPWVAGTTFLIYLAGLQAIPESIIEASKLDGANIFQRIIKIDLPLLKGQMKYFIVMGIIGGMQNINMQLLVTGSGPGTSNAVNVPSYMIYENAFSYDRYGYASTIGIILFIITLTITIISRREKKEI